jgi:hypothetical protein
VTIICMLRDLQQQNIWDVTSGQSKHWHSKSPKASACSSKSLNGWKRRPTSIVSSALSPSTIAPNELEFCKESSVTKNDIGTTVQERTMKLIRVSGYRSTDDNHKIHEPCFP